MIRINGLKLPVGHEASDIMDKIANKMCLDKIYPGNSYPDFSFRILRRSIDARRHPDIFLIYTVLLLIDEKDELAVQNEELNKSVEELTQATTILQEENDELKGQIHNTIEGIEGILTELKATAGIEDAAPLEEDAQEAAVEAIELVEEPAAEAAVEEAAAEEAVTEEAVTEEAQPQDEAAVTEGEEEETFTNVSENLKDQLKQEMMAVMDSEEAQP